MPAGAQRSQAGSGLLSTLFGVSALLVMLGFSVNVALGLWSRSTVDAIAWDAARHVATADPAAGAHTEAVALERAKAILGSRANEVRLEFTSPQDSELVALHVRAPGVSLLPRLFTDRLTVGDLDHTIVMRRETT